MKKNKPIKAGTSKMSATDRKNLFAEAYLSNGGNATQAAIAAGYTESGAGKQGSRMSKDPYILSIVRQRQDALAKKHELTTDSIIAELSKIVHADLRKLVNENGSIKPVHEWPDDMAGAIAAIETTEIGQDGVSIGMTKKIKLWDKNSAIEKAMKHLGMFERDNAQKTDPIREFLQQCSGRSLPIAADE
jgi:phage terminase small subunit